VGSLLPFYGRYFFGPEGTPPTLDMTWYDNDVPPWTKDTRSILSNLIVDGNDTYTEVHLLMYQMKKSVQWRHSSTEKGLKNPN
jgi:hypothetical protein